MQFFGRRRLLVCTYFAWRRRRRRPISIRFVAPIQLDSIQLNSTQLDSTRTNSPRRPSSSVRVFNWRRRAASGRQDCARLTGCILIAPRASERLIASQLAPSYTSRAKWPTTNKRERERERRPCAAYRPLRRPISRRGGHLAGLLGRQIDLARRQ